MYFLKSKKPFYLTVAIATATLTFFYLFSMNNSDLKEISLKPPIPELTPGYTIYSIDASVDNELLTPNQTKIIIPACALVDSLGNNIEGLAEIYYREYLEVNDILLSGLPMEFNKEMMASGGMFDIKAMQENRIVRIDPNAEISLEMPKEKDSIDYPIWQMNETTLEWEASENSIQYRPNEDLLSLKEKQNEIDAVFKMPLDLSYFCFNYISIIDVQYGNYNPKASVDVLKKVQDYGFSFSNVNLTNSISYYQQTFPASMMLWHNLSNTKIPNNGNNYQSKLEIVNEKKNIYQLTVIYGKDTLFENNIQAVMPLKHLYRYSPQSWEDNYQNYLAEMDSIQTVIENTPVFVMKSTIAYFGIYNYDYLINNQDAKPLAAKFILSTGKQAEEVFYVVKSDNIVVRYPQRDWHNFRLLDKKEDLIVCILDNRRVEVYYPSTADFEQTKNTDTFYLKASDVIINSKEDFMTLFEMEELENLALN